jgi:predicted ATPase
LLEAYHCRWSTAFFRGDVADALDDCLRGVELYDVARHRHHGQQFGGHDPGVCAHSLRGSSFQLAGAGEDCAQCLVQALTLAEMLDHPNSLAHALHSIATAHQLGSDRDATYAAAHRGFGLAEKFGLLPWRAGCLVLTAWATAIGSGIADAAQVIDVEIGNATAVGPLPQYYLGLAAEVLLAARRPSDGLAHLDRAIAGIDDPEVGFYLPEIHRLRGACLLALGRGNKDEARSAFITAREIARRQGAVILERRAENSLLGLAGN